MMEQNSSYLRYHSTWDILKSHNWFFKGSPKHIHPPFFISVKLQCNNNSTQYNI